MERRLIDVNDLGRYAVAIDGHKYIPWVSLAEVPTAEKVEFYFERISRREEEA